MNQKIVLCAVKDCCVLPLWATVGASLSEACDRQCLMAGESPVRLGPPCNTECKIIRPTVLKDPVNLNVLP